VDGGGEGDQLLTFYKLYELPAILVVDPDTGAMVMHRYAARCAASVVCATLVCAISLHQWAVCGAATAEQLLLNAPPLFMTRA
jgi:hypothetical protein